MNRQLFVVATGFRLAGAVLGLASIAALVVIVPDAFAPHPTGGGAHYLDIQKYGLVGLLQNAVNGVGTVLSFFAGAATFVLTILALVFVALLGFAVVLYLTGLGIQRLAAWARIVAILTSCGAFLLSAFWLLLALQTPRPAPVAIAALMVCLPLYAIWVLILGYRRIKL